MLENCKIKEIFHKIKIPAVTNVEECTIAEIGVGADIAAGSQDENGNCALLVNEQIIIKEQKIITSRLLKKKNKLGEKILQTKITIKIKSPSRLKKNVIKELNNEVLFG